MEKKKNLSISKKQKSSGSETGKLEEKYYYHFSTILKKGNGKIEFPASRLSTKCYTK